MRKWRTHKKFLSYPDVQTRTILVSNWMELGWATLNLCRLAILFFRGCLPEICYTPKGCPGVTSWPKGIHTMEPRLISWNLVCYADNDYLWRPTTKRLHSGLAELQPNFLANTRAKVDTSNYIYWARCIFVNHIVDAPSKLSQECYAHPWLYVTTADDDNLWRPRIKRWGFAS